MKAIKDALGRLGGDKRGAAPETADFRLLFVCMGNICRSPTAQGVFEKVLGERAPDLVVHIDSAGTHGYHVGEAPDPRACRAAERRGIDLTTQRARRVAVEDFERFDLILCMDKLNHVTLIDLAPPHYHERVRLLLEFAADRGGGDVPDPYYGGSNGFEHVLDLVEEASLGLVEYLLERRRATVPQQGSR